MNIPRQAGVALEIAAAAAVGVALAGLSVGVGLAAIVAIKLLTSSEDESPKKDEKPEPPIRSSTQNRDVKKAPVDEKKEPSVAGKDIQKERSAPLKVAKNTDSVPPMPLTPPAIPTSIAKDTHSLPVRKPSVLDRKNDVLPVRNIEPSRRLVEPLIPTVIRASVIQNIETRKVNVATSETRVDRDEPKHPPPPNGHSDTSSDDWLHIGSTASLVSSSQEQVTNHESSVQTTAEDLATTSTDPALVPSAAEQSSPSSDLEPSSLISSTVVQETFSKTAPVAQPEQFTSSVFVPAMKEDLPISLPEEAIASISPMPELPPSRTQSDVIAPLAEIQETKPETPASVDEPAVSVSHPMESSFVSAVTSFSDPDSPDPASSDASGPSAGALSDSVLQAQPSFSRKRRPSLVASAAKKVSKSVKGAFKDSNNNNNINAGPSKANPAALTSPSNDSLSSAQSHGKVDALKGYTTSPSRDSLTSSKSGRSVISAAKDGVKRMLSTKDKSRSSSATPSVDPMGSSSSVETPQAPSSSAPPPQASPAVATSSGNTFKKKQRQQQASQDDGNASPMLKGMFKGRRPAKASA